MKVYGWQDHRNGVGQVRAIVAASSKAAATRCAGETDARRLFNLCETGNDIELQVARAKPGVVHWVSMSNGDEFRAGKDPSLWKTDT
jgi:hypothetical protein